MGGTGHVDGARRILLYGVTGSGKSTLARELADATGIEWTDVDDHTWRPGWTPVPDDEQVRYFADVCTRDAWILDTAYRQWRDVVLTRTELVVALDYARWRSLARLVRRTVTRVVTREPVCHGNTESLRQVLSHDSIIAWHFRSFRRKRAVIEDWAASTDGPRLVRLRTPRATSAWLAQVRAASPRRSLE